MCWTKIFISRFYEPVTFQPNIIPVCVPEDDEDLVGQEAWVTGWGRLYEGKHIIQNSYPAKLWIKQSSFVFIYLQ